MSKDIVKELCDVAAQAVELARRAGAEGVEAVARDGAELTAKVRLGETELVQEAGSRAMGLRVFVEGRTAVTYTSDFTPAALERFARDTVALARLSEPDALNRLPEAEELARSLPELELWDEGLLSVDAAWAIQQALRGEGAARRADPRITLSEGATWSRTLSAAAFANSAGFVGGYRGTHATLSVEPVCDDTEGKKRNGAWWTASRFLARLQDAEEVGLEAARRTLARLGSRKVATCEVPVVFSPEAGSGLLRELFGVVNGAAFYRKASYLFGREGQPVASPLVTVVDDPLLPGGTGSRPFDGDGLPARRNVVLNAGVLETVLCDVYSARKLGRRSTGSAGRPVGGAPSPTVSNFLLQAGATRPEDIVRTVERGLYVTDMMGYGFNPVTGDFSRGAGGFWIEKGERVFPVSEITLSANFSDLWSGVDAVGDDVDLRTHFGCPTFRVARMTVGGR